MKYIFDMIGAYKAGAREHPQTEIRKVCPDAYDLYPHPMFDCWVFESPTPIASLPSYVHEPYRKGEGPPVDSRIKTEIFSAPDDAGKCFKITLPGLGVIPENNN